MHFLYRSEISTASCVARSGVPSQAPSPPAASTAARARPLAMPPAAITGVPPAHVEHLSQERKRSEASGVAAGLVALGHEDVGAQVKGEASRFRRLDLAENPGPHSLGFRHVSRRITKREREDRDALFEARAKVLDPLGNLLRDEADPERFARVSTHEADLLPDPCRAATMDAAKEAEPPGSVDGRGETATGGPTAEWRQHDGARKPEHLGEPSLQHSQPSTGRHDSRHETRCQSSPRSLAYLASNIDGK